MSAAVAAPSPDMGVIRQAMAWRVKCRLVADDGEVKRSVPIELIGIDDGNRGGVYPNQDDVRTLGVKIAGTGFLQEEADYQGVCVEDVPDGHRVSGRPTLSRYNLDKCSGQDFLMDAFRVGCVLGMGTLSHSHLPLVSRCWIRKAKWNITDKDGHPLHSTLDGRLDLNAAMASENLREMGLSIKDGLKMEVLSWKMKTEEPDAASLISRALNSGHEMALRTTELTAVAVLSGEIARQRNAGCRRYAGVRVSESKSQASVGFHSRWA